jgi:hypothetical protein
MSHSARYCYIKCYLRPGCFLTISHLLIAFQNVDTTIVTLTAARDLSSLMQHPTIERGTHDHFFALVLSVEYQSCTAQASQNSG